MFWIIGGGGIVAALDHALNNRFTQLLHRQMEHKPWAGFAFEDKVTTGPRAKPTMPPAVKRPTPRLALDA